LLFLDELPEFGSRMLEMLRRPLDPTDKVVSISRSAGALTYPANFTLVASMNPCLQNPTT
jgi:magnesium chelatase family protein